MRTHSASSRAARSRAASQMTSDDDEEAEADVLASDEQEVEPYWLPWHIDPNTVSTLTGDAYFDFASSQALEFDYPQSGALQARAATITVATLSFRSPPAHFQCALMPRALGSLARHVARAALQTWVCSCSTRSARRSTSLSTSTRPLSW